MPIFQYGCSNCKDSFEKVLRLMFMEEPLSESCPLCGSNGTITQMTTTANFGDPVRMGHKRPDAGFNDRLKEIKKAHPRGYWDNKKFNPISGR